MWAPKHGTLNPFPSTKEYATFPFDGDEPEWRPYIPQHIGLTEIGKQSFGKIKLNLFERSACSVWVRTRNITLGIITPI